MIDPPDQETLLEAVALFLMGEIKGAVSDPKLGFRVLIAAHLTATLAAELRGQEAQDAAELGRLRQLLPDFAEKLNDMSFSANSPSSASAADAEKLNDMSFRRAAIRRLNGELAARLRDGRLGGASWAAAFDHLQQTLAEKLRVVSPRFALEPDIE